MTINQPVAPHGLSAEIIEMIHVEIATALASLKRIYLTSDSQRVLATIVVLEEVLPEFAGSGRRPRSAIRWLERANQLLQRSGAIDVDEARQHTRAARDLLARE